MDCIKKLLKKQEEPERPDRDYDADMLGKQRYTEPRIVDVEVDVKTRGSYRTKNGTPMGLVIHYDAGRDGNHIGTLRYMARKGLGCLAMDKNGVIYKAKNQRLTRDVAYHAGRSSYGGKEGLSFYCLGLEVNCAGKLDQEGRRFKTWFGATVPADQVRHTDDVVDARYVRKGHYQIYTPNQEVAILNFCLYLYYEIPGFSIDYVVGHDEIAVPRGRKSDPGASLSMDMDSFRNKLRIMINANR